MSKKLQSLPLLFFTFLYSCDAGTAFVGSDKSQKASDNEVEPEVENPDGDEPEIETISLSMTLVQEQAKTDYLLVIDNSVSMNPFLTAINTGFESLSTSDLSSDHRIAAISTMAEDYNNPGQRHPKVIETYFAIDEEPGFLSLKNRESILAFRDTIQQATAGQLSNGEKTALLDNFSNFGCENSWIKLGDKNAEGESCLKSLLQIGNTAVGCEPGVNAFAQFIDKVSAKKDFFRSDAALNIIFISDEAYPGCTTTTDFTDNCKSAQHYKDQIKSSWGVDQVVFNGIVNDSEINSTKTCNYKSLATESGGALVKMDDPEKYKEAILQIIDKTKSSDQLTYNFQEAVEIDEILIDGKKYTNFELKDKKLVIKGLSSVSLTAKVEVKFVKKPTG